MYYIYHIPEIKKIGCTNDLKNREEKQQGYKKYIVLYKTPSIKKASEKEIELQKKYNYKIDINPYFKARSMQSKIYKTSHTTTFINSNKENIHTYNFPKYIDVNETRIYLNEDMLRWIKSNNHKSQYSEERFIYNQSLFNYYSANKKNNIFDDIRSWANERGIYDKGDPKTQLIKLYEETGELAQALLKNDRKGIIDAIGDSVVVLTNFAKLVGTDIETCIQSAYDEISNRTGEMKNGTFVKNK